MNPDALTTTYPSTNYIRTPHFDACSIMFRSKANSFLFFVVVVVVSCLLGSTTTTTEAFSPLSTTTFLTTTTTMTSKQSISTFRLFDGPAVLDRPETIEIIDVEKNTEKQEKIGGEAWEIRLFNDPFNKREFVARCLAEVCGKSDTESYQIMMQAHKNGMGLVGRYNFEIAEMYHGSLQENGLMVDMVQVDDE